MITPVSNSIPNVQSVLSEPPAESISAQSQASPQEYQKLYMMAAIVNELRILNGNLALLVQSMFPTTNPTA